MSTGPLATFQDLGRPGYAHLGVPASGAADRSSLRLANRLVGNPESSPGVEVTLGGWSARANGLVVMAVTGPPVRVLIDGRPVGSHAAFGIWSGQTVTVEAPATGCRNYVAVRGGFSPDLVLGSAATDTLSGLGPPPLAVGDVLPVADDADDWPPVTAAPGPPPRLRETVLAVRPGPRADRVANVEALYSSTWTVNPASNRIGVRLDVVDGERPTHRDGAAAAASEGVPLGGVQIPPSGQPVLFLADHPVTGGYPVVAVLTAQAVDAAAQLVAGDRVRLRLD